MMTPPYLSSPSTATTPDYMKLWQEEFLTGFLTRLAPGPVKPASIMLEPDLEDGVIRSWPRQDERLPPLLANALTPVHPEFRDYTRSIAFRLPESEIGRAHVRTPVTNAHLVCRLLL